QTRLTPFAGLAWQRLHTPGYQESGGIAALRGEGQNLQTTTTTLGLRAQHQLDTKHIKGTVRATAAWEHGFGDMQARVSQAFDGGQLFVVHGLQPAKDAAL